MLIRWLLQSDNKLSGDDFMSKKNSSNNRITNFLMKLSEKRRIILIMVAVYFSFLVFYDILISKRVLSANVIIGYVGTIVVCVFIWFAVRLVFWIQIKNPFCTERILNIFIFVTLISFGLLSIIFSIQYFADGFLISTFIAPMAFVSVLSANSLRKEKADSNNTHKELS